FPSSTAGVAPVTVGVVVYLPASDVFFVTVVESTRARRVPPPTSKRDLDVLDASTHTANDLDARCRRPQHATSTPRRSPAADLDSRPAADLTLADFFSCCREAPWFRDTEATMSGSTNWRWQITIYTLGEQGDLETAVYTNRKL
ncbi:hypothetical protein EJB05_22260, partial [Eragrostis curvula]